MTEKSKAQETKVERCPAFPEDRQTEPQKVGWMTVLYPSVSGPEYRRFRKSFGGMTHHDFTATAIADQFAKTGVPKREDIVQWLVNTYVKRDWVKYPGIEIQVPQFLAQLTQRGWNGLINHSLKIIEGRQTS